jgi:osmoprotectant transport system substrate-binding protein
MIKNKPAGLVFVSMFLMSLFLMACGATATTAPTSATTAPAVSATTAAAPAAITPASGNKPKVVVASADFTEARITGEIYAGALEAAGIPVERKMGLGTVAIIHTAITKGEVSMYPTYTGTGYGVVLKLTEPLNDPKALYDKVATEFKKQFQLTLTDAAPMNNSNGIAVTKAIADKYKLKTLSDLAPVAKELRFATNPEFVADRSNVDGLGSLQKTYGGFVFKDQKQVEINLRYKALVDNQADACVAFTTDGEISGYNLVLMEDDKKNFPPYQLVPVVRDDILAAYPNMKDVLNKVSAKITTAEASAMNWKASGPEKKEPVDIAKDFLKAQGFAK